MQDSTWDKIYKLAELVGDPFLITALVVVYLMYRLLQRKEKTFDGSLKDVFNEINAMSKLLNQQATTIKVLVDMIVAYGRERRHSEEENREEAD